jgi:hypothetical protein
MKRSESDRFIADPSRDEHDVSAEVYLIVTDEGRRAESISWKHFATAMAMAIVVAAAAIFATSLESGAGRGRASSRRIARISRSARSAQGPPPVAASASSCVDTPGYGGLGARVSAFDANNNDSTGAGEPSSGTAFYVVTATARGCTMGFAVQDGTTPPLTTRDLLVLVSNPFLPGDAKQVVNTGTCAIWKSRALMRATGRAYARATATSQAGDIPGTAKIAATSSSAC